MNAAIQPADLGFFSVLVAAGSLSAAAREQGITTPAISKRLAQMEARLGVPLLNRTTRRMSLTAEGELYLERARAILGEIDVAPVISRFVRKYPRVDVGLQLSS